MQNLSSTHSGVETRTKKSTDLSPQHAIFLDKFRLNGFLRLRIHCRARGDQRIRHRLWCKSLKPLRLDLALTITRSHSSNLTLTQHISLLAPFRKHTNHQTAPVFISTHPKNQYQSLTISSAPLSLNSSSRMRHPKSHLRRRMQPNQRRAMTSSCTSV